MPLPCAGASAGADDGRLWPTAAELSGANATGVAALAAATAPASSISHTTAPTGTVSPSSTNIAATVPLKGDGISDATLSVSTSSSGSYLTIASPFFLSQRPTVPSVTVSPSCGMVTCANAANLLKRREIAHRRGDALRAWHECVFVDLRIAHRRHIRTAQAADRRIELEQCLLGDDRRDLRADTADFVVLVHDEDFAGLGRSCQNCV